MEKLRLPKEVADGIKYLRENYKSGCEYDIGLILREGWEVTIPILAYVESSRENLENYFRSLVNGYEVELSPEDRVRKYCINTLSIANGTEIRAGIIDVLNILGIKIEGVNG